MFRSGTRSWSRIFLRCFLIIYERINCNDFKNPQDGATCTKITQNTEKMVTIRLCVRMLVVVPVCLIGYTDNSQPIVAGTTAKIKCKIVWPCLCCRSSSLHPSSNVDLLKHPCDLMKKHDSGFNLLSRSVHAGIVSVTMPREHRHKKKKKIQLHFQEKRCYVNCLKPGSSLCSLSASFLVHKNTGCHKSDRLLLPHHQHPLRQLATLINR